MKEIKVTIAYFGVVKSVEQRRLLKLAEKRIGIVLWHALSRIIFFLFLILSFSLYQTQVSYLPNYLLVAGNRIAKRLLSFLREIE